MSNRAESPGWRSGYELVQTGDPRDPRNSTRRTAPQIAESVGGQKEKSYDDPRSRRGVAEAYPRRPGEEMGSLDDSSVYSDTDEDSIDLKRRNASEPTMPVVPRTTSRGLPYTSIPYHETSAEKRRPSLIAKIKFKKARKEDVQRILKLPARPDKNLTAARSTLKSSDDEDTTEHDTHRREIAPSPTPDLNEDDIQKGVKEPPRPQSDDSRKIPSLMPDDSGKPTRKPFSIVPDAPSRDYIHRQSLEDEIHSKLSVGGAQIALVGEGRMGKSELALQIAYETKKHRPETHVLWFPSSGMADLERNISTIRAILNLTRDTPQHTILALFRSRLLNPADGKWLIVLDGFDYVQGPLESMDGRVLFRAIPVVSHGSTILTFRRNTEFRFFTNITVEPLSEEEAVSYLKLRIAEHNAMGDMVQLARAVDGEPMALSRAAYRFETSGMALGEYAKKVQLEREKWAYETSWFGGRSAIDPMMVESKRPLDAADLTRKAVEGERAKVGPAIVPPPEPSSTAQDSGYGSYEPGSIVQEVIKEQEKGPDSQSDRTLSSFVDLGPDGRLRGINIFASHLAQSLSPDISEVVEGRELVITAVQDAVRAYSYSLEQQNRPSKLSDERKAAHFVRQQSHDIAVKVVDYIARARSAESGEVPPEAGMFAEPINVLSWMGHSSNSVADSTPATAENSDQIAITEDFVKEDTQLDDTIQRMSNFLSDNATFEWLKQRVQAVISISGGGELTAVSKKLSSILKQGFSAANDQNFKYTIDWDPLEFMQVNYSGYVDVASVVSVNSDGQVCEAWTVGEYIARVWPMTGPRVLEALRTWWAHISNGRGEEPLTCTLPNGEVTLTRQSSLVHVDVAGPMFLGLDIGEQIAWLASVCRKGLFPDQLTSVRPILWTAGSKSVPTGGTLNISFASKKFVHDAHSVDGRCWLKLFLNCCIADGVSVSTRQEDEKGLEMPFSLIATLGGFDRVANYAGQLVLKGFETLFVPMKKSGGSIIWHLVTKPNGRRISYNAMYALPGQLDATVCMQDLYNSRHFLGWVSSASQHTGTEDGVYDQDNEVFLDPPGQGLVLSGVAISMSKIVGIAATITPGRQDRGIRTSSKEMFYVEVVEKMSKMHVLLYDHGDGRGWLVDGASAVLHLLRFHVARYRPICDGERFRLEEFQYADSTAGGKSARDVLLSRAMRRVVLVEEPLPDSEKQVTETVDGITTVKTVVEGLMKRKTAEDRVRDLYEILELMYDSWKRRKTAPGIALESLNMKLEGWKFQDVVELENDMNPVVAKLDGSADDWLRMVRHVNTVVLIGNGFGDMMKPMGDFCTNWGTVPQKDFCVAVPVSRLKRIAQKYGDPRMTPIKLTPDVFWPINQHPFICTCASASGRPTCYRGQQLRSNGLRSGSLQLDILTAAEHANGAVIFEGRRSVKQMAQKVTHQSYEHRKSVVKTAWLRNVRNRFRSKKENGPNASAAA